MRITASLLFLLCLLPSAIRSCSPRPLPFSATPSFKCVIRSFSASSVPSCSKHSLPVISALFHSAGFLLLADGLPFSRHLCFCLKSPFFCRKFFCHLPFLHLFVQVSEETNCVECGGAFKVVDMIAHAHQHVCARCKPVFLQKLSEGAPTPPPLAPRR